MRKQQRGPGGKQLRPVKAVEHALDLLHCLAEEAELGVSDLARRTGLSKPSVYHILGTLEARRCITQNPRTGQYRLGWGLFELGAAVTRRVELIAVAQPFLELLSRSTGETTQLAVAAGTELLYVARHEAARSIRMAAAVGKRLPLHATASGKVLLAWYPREEIEEILAGPLERYTPATITDPDLLRADLEGVRNNGYAQCLAEHESDVNATATPVRNFAGEVVAALSLAGPVTRFDLAAMESARSELLAVAGRISADLGYGISTQG